ncbi:MAG: hypothetical protein LBC70_09050 [Chitinispirillales bacterium]|jgi:hypothetical protein|nr:hypothetical protein [Chitinispirillales bacterium]
MKLSMKRTVSITSLITVIAALLITVNCGGSPALWKPVQPGYTKYSGKLGFSVNLPAGWMAYEDKSALLLTRHSVPLGFIMAWRHPLSTPLPYTELSINKHMQIYEIAEIVTGNLLATPGVFNLVVEELTPDEIDGKRSFSLLISYTMENGLRRRCLIYGFVSGRHYTEIGLYALEDYYFDALLKDFFELAGSFRVSGR